MAQAALAVFTQYCAACHGKNGSGEAGIDFFDDLGQIVTQGYVVPGNLQESQIFERLESGSMPPASAQRRPAPADVDKVKQWIMAGAPNIPQAVRREKISLAQVEDLMLRDLERIPERDRRYVRYLSLTNFYNLSDENGVALVSDEEIGSYRRGALKMLNSLSRNQKIVIPVEVKDSAGTLLRFRLDAIQWEPETWAMLQQNDSYALKASDDTGVKVRQYTGTEYPTVRADWLAAKATLTPLYDMILGIPRDLHRLQAAMGISLVDLFHRGELYRSGFVNSGVSQNNRMVERAMLPNRRWWVSAESVPFRSGGYLWNSYDFSSSVERNNLLRFPLGPSQFFASGYGAVANEVFQHAGGEIIWSLPNRLQAYMLVKSDFTKIEDGRGPIQIVSDPLRPDRTVVNALSCMSCHAEGIKRKQDEVRPTILSNRQAFERQFGDHAATIVPLLLKVHAPQSDLDKAFANDQRDFVAALTEMGIDPKEPEPITSLARQFEAAVTLDKASAELGVAPGILLAAIATTNVLAANALLDLGPLKAKGGVIKREVFAKQYRVVAEIIQAVGSNFTPVSADGEPTAAAQVTCSAEVVRAAGGAAVREISGEPRSSEREAKAAALEKCQRFIQGLTSMTCRAKNKPCTKVEEN